jgi:hypothetical protein
MTVHIGQVQSVSGQRLLDLAEAVWAEVPDCQEFVSLAFGEQLGAVDALAVEHDDDVLRHADRVKAVLVLSSVIVVLFVGLLFRAAGLAGVLVVVRRVRA